ncbi:hypothetical protein [Streptomyces thermoalcalitolerans]|uniref:DNA-binding protein n=1 Tax=Streptomyces thermoalcalitolerans TaxID=65605 RepID=A0ABN1P9B5_9ACTN
MRKRPSRPARFTQVDNGAIDSIQSMIAKGLLVTLVRARDGADITIEGLAETHNEGRASLEKAMRALVKDGYVVKFKIQQQTSDGVRRGGAWRTEVIADTIPIDREWVAQQLDEILAEGNVRAVRIEPEFLDPRARNRRPTDRRNPAVGPTCENAADSDKTAGGTDRRITDGRSTDRRSGGGSIRKNTVVKDSLSGRTRPLGDELEAVTSEERESSATREEDTAAATADAAAPVVDAWVSARTQAGHGIPLRGSDRIRQDAVRLLADGVSVEHLAAAAADMGRRADWLDLGRHLERFVAPASKQPEPDGPRCPYHQSRALDECPCQRAEHDDAEQDQEAAAAPPPRDVLAAIMAAVGAAQTASARRRPRMPTRAERDAAARAEEEANRRRANELLDASTGPLVAQ